MASRSSPPRPSSLSPDRADEEARLAARRVVLLLPGVDDGTVGLLVRPSWPEVVLPYSGEEVVQLEGSIMRWLVEAGAITRKVAAQVRLVTGT